MKKVLFVIALLSSLVAWDLQAQVSFKTLVSKKQLATGERLRINYKISSSGGNFKQSQFTPPDFKGFQKIMGPSTSQEYSYVNGQMSSSFTYGYVLQARKPGTYTIKPASVVVNGKTYKTQPVEIKVVKGQANSGNNVYPGGNQDNTPKSNNITIKDKIEDAVLVAELTKTNPYVNEAVGLVYKLYIPSKYGVVNYNETGQPEFKGFWTQDIDKKIAGPFEGKVNGKPYIYYILRKKLLFPQHAGKLTLKPLTLQIDLQVPVYRNFFGMRVPDYEIQRVKLTSGKKILRVKELPKNNQPLDFSGAVGNFDFKVKIDNNHIKSGEPVNLSLQVSGTGNLKLFDLPKLKAPEGLEIYEPKRVEQVQTTFSGNRGLVRDDYIIVPDNAGKYIIPGVRFVYFNPKTGQYESKISDEIVLFVTGGNTPSNQTGTLNSPRGDKTQAIDFRFIKDKAHFIAKQTSVFYKSKLFYGLILSSFILALLAFVYYKYLSNKVYDAVYEKQKKNKALAQKFLKEAKNSLGEKESFYARLEKALHNFLKAQLDIDTSEMSRDIIGQKLADKNVSNKTVALLMDLLNRCDMARYAPATTTKMEEDLSDAEKLMTSF